MNSVIKNKNAQLNKNQYFKTKAISKNQFSNLPTINNHKTQEFQNYSSQRRFKELTKNIRRLDQNKRNHQSIKNQSQYKSKESYSRPLLTNQESKVSSSKQTNFRSRQLKKSASGKYFSLVDIEEKQQQKSDRQQKQNPIKSAQIIKKQTIKRQPKKKSVYQKQQSIKNEQNSKNKQYQKIKQNSTIQKPFKKFKPLKTFVLFQVAINILFGIPALYMFFTLSSDFKYNLATIQYISITLFYILSSIHIVWGYGKKGVIQFIMMYFLLDTLFLILIVVSIGFIGMLTVSFSHQWFSYINLVGIPFMNFVFIGNFRLFLKWTILTSWQLIIWKLSFFIDGMIYFGIGAYYMAVDYKLTGGYLPQLESKLKDFCLLFVFANFSLYIQMFGAIGGKDKTQQLEYRYVTGQDQQEKSNCEQQNKKNKQFWYKIKDKSEQVRCKHCNNCKNSKINMLMNDEINDLVINQTNRNDNELKDNNKSIHNNKQIKINQNIKNSRQLQVINEVYYVGQQSPICNEKILIKQINQNNKLIIQNNKLITQNNHIFNQITHDNQRMFFTINKIN